VSRGHWLRQACCAAAVSALAAAGPVAQAPAAPEEPSPPADTAAAAREVLAVLDGLVRAMERRDTAALVRLFLPGARLVGLRPRQRGPVLQSLTAEEFAGFMGRDRRDRWIERVHDPEIRIDGTLATVWARYDFWFGERLSHCGTDAFQLLRTEAGWRIASLADNYRTEDCGRDQRAPRRPGTPARRAP
jgi:hypothetical protein